MKRLEMPYGTGLYYQDGNEICLGDKVSLVTGDTGEITFERGAYGIVVWEGIDYEKVQSEMDRNYGCCGNKYHGCRNDNFISLWELYWNFNCEEDCLCPVERIEDNK